MASFMVLGDLPHGQLSLDNYLGQLPPGQFPPRTIAPGLFPPSETAPWEIPPDSSHLGLLYYPSGYLHPGNYCLEQ